MQENLPTEIYNGYKKTLGIQGASSAGTSGVLGAIKAASAKTGVDFAYLLNKASQESGLNPAAKAAGSSATGLYQFINQTWLQMVKTHGEDYGLGVEASAIQMKNGKAVVADKAMQEKILNLRHDPVLSAAMAAEFTKENKNYLEARVDGAVGSTELYLAHFLGAGGAKNFLNAMQNSPSHAAADFLPEAARANPSVFYSKSGHALSLQDIYDRFAAKFTGDSNVRNVRNVPTVQMAQIQSEPVVRHTVSARSVPEKAGDLPVSFASAKLPDSSASFLNNATPATLFNVMVMAQNSLNETLAEFAKAKSTKTKSESGYSYAAA